MEENIRDIKRNLEEIRIDLKIISDKSRVGIPIEFEMILIHERLWDIVMNIKDLETFI